MLWLYISDARWQVTMLPPVLNSHSESELLAGIIGIIIIIIIIIIIEKITFSND